MPIRNRHKPGDWLVVDDESGFVHYASEMVRLWDGSYVHKSQYETRNPQEFVRPGKGDEPPIFVRPAAAISAFGSAIPTSIGSTNVLNQTKFTNFITVLANTSAL